MDYGLRSSCFKPSCSPTRLFALVALAFSLVSARAATLGTATRLEGPGPGLDSVVLSASSSWTAAANASWLHLSAPNQSGDGSTNVIFSFDANPGATRTGTLTIAGQTLTVTQAGTNYVATPAVTTDLIPNYEIDTLGQLAVDTAGNVYNADANNNGDLNGPSIEQWTAANNTSTYLSTGNLNGARGLAVDAAGNVYIGGYSAIYEWSPVTHSLSQLVSGLNYPSALALDSQGDLYIADTYNNVIKEWSAADQTVTTLPISGLSNPGGVAVDVAGNVYIADSGNGAVKEWSAANNTVTTLASGLNYPQYVAVDGAGNVYFTANVSLEEWCVASNSLITLQTPGVTYPYGLALDALGNIYISDESSDNIVEEPRAYVSATRLEGFAAGSDTLPPVLPAGENLLAPFAPASDQSWLTINGITDGAVSFSFTSATANRTAHITLLGQKIAVTQYDDLLTQSLLYVGPAAGSDNVGLLVEPAAPQAWTASSQASWLHLSISSGTGSATVGFTFDSNPGATRSGTLTIAGQTLVVVQEALSLGSTNRVEGPSAGTDSVTLSSLGDAWTAAANAGWLHLSAANQSGPGSTNVVFSFDANPGIIRIGTLTIAGQTLTLTQAGSNYVAAPGPLTSLASGLSNPGGTAVDAAGNVYIADRGIPAVEKWSPGNDTMTLLITNGLTTPVDVAVDGAGNVYIADSGNNAIEEWSPVTSTLTTLVSAGLNSPNGVAVDGAGNVYISDSGNDAIEEWSPASGSLVTLVSLGLNSPGGVAVDAAGNVYIIESGNGTLHEWSPATGNLALLSSALSFPGAVRVDGAGNVYAAEYGQIAVWSAAGQTLSTMPIPISYAPGGVAVDSLGNAYLADPYTQNLYEQPRAFVDPTSNVEGLAAGSDSLSPVLPVTENLLAPFAPSTDQPWLTVSGINNGVVSFAFTAAPNTRFGHISLLGESIPVSQYYDILNENVIYVGPGAGGNSVSLTVNPDGPQSWTASSQASWLHLSTTSGSGSATVNFTYDTNPGPVRSGTLTIASQTFTVVQEAFSLGTTNRVEGPAAGTDSVVLGSLNSSWTATANAPWLHLSAANQSGTGSTNVVFTFDSNAGATRTGTLTIAGQTLTVTQAGSTYVQAPGPLTPLVSAGNAPYGLAVDGAGNVYIGNYNNSAVAEWSPESNLATALPVSGISGPIGVALDSAGNVYLADANNNAIDEFMPSENSTTALVTNGLSNPYGVAVDTAGDVYIADTGNNAIKEWSPITGQVTLLVTNGLNSPQGIAVDAAGNVYIADTDNNAVKEWSPATGNVATLVSSGLNSPTAVAVDGAGNVFIANAGNNAVVEWSFAGDSVANVASGFNYPQGIAVDAAGNVYIADTGNANVDELPRAFTDPSTRLEALNAGSDMLPPVLPVTEDLLPPFAPGSDQSWLTITGVTNGVVNFAFTGTGAQRLGHISLLGQSITISQFDDALGASLVYEGPAAGSGSVALTVSPQAPQNWTASSQASWLHLSVTSGSGSASVGFTFDANPGPARAGTLTIAGQALTVIQEALALGTTNRLEGPAAGTDSVVLSATGESWTATANASWLHLSAPAQSGTGSANVAFEFDANSGATRTGTLTIDGMTVTVTQAGSTYVQAPGPVTALSAGLNAPAGVAVDSAGNVYFADSANNAIKEWFPSDNSTIALPISGLNNPNGVALDGAGNLYIADSGNNAVEKWSLTGNTFTPLITSGLNNPGGVAVDGAGNLYVADSGNNAIEEWTALTGTLTPLLTNGFNNPRAVTLDAAGNLYIADSGNDAIEEWSPVNNTFATLSISGLSSPGSVAVDGAGNLYIADTGNSVIKEWSAAGNTVATLIPSGLNGPNGVAVDESGNVYLADSGDNAVDELPYAFVDPTPKAEGPLTGSDILPTVLPATADLLSPFAPASSQPWLTLTGVNNGVVGFAFSSDTGTTRSGAITVLGTSIAVTQYVDTLSTNVVYVGAESGATNVYLTVDPAGPQAWTASSQASWLHLPVTSGSGSATVSFTFDANPVAGVTRTGTLVIGTKTVTVIQTSYALGFYARWDGPAAGTDSVVLSSVNAPWTATANASWLHLSAPNQSGFGSRNLAFNYDTDSGATRAGTLTIAGMTFTVTQAGTNYIAAPGPSTTLSTSVPGPSGAAVDASGNVYFAGYANNTIDEWIAASNTTIALVTSGLDRPSSVAVDGAGNVYIADIFNNAIKEWSPASHTVTTLVSSGLSDPSGVAVDAAGNVYIADTRNDAIKEWSPVSQTITTLVSSGLNNPEAVAVDAAGNVYIADYENNAVKEWMPANNTVTTLVSSGLNFPSDVAVDGAGNVYIADSQNNAIKVWSAVSNTVTTLVSSGADDAEGVAVDGLGNLFFDSYGDQTVSELPRAFVDPTPKVEGRPAGADMLSAVLPPTENLLAPFAPTSSESWLTITGISDDAVSFAFAANGSYYTRTANINLLGQPIVVTQPGENILGTTNSTEGPAAGMDSVVLGTLPTIAWTASSQASWLHLSAAAQSGIGGTNVIFSFDTNSGATRVGTLTIAGVTLTVTQAGSTYVPAPEPLTTLASSGFGEPAGFAAGMAVDGAGNVFFPNEAQVSEWMASNDSVTNLPISGLTYAISVALDGAGNIYIADADNRSVFEWANGNRATLVSSPVLNLPSGVAVDAAGNVYISDSGNNAVYEWLAQSNTVTTLATGLSGPKSVAVDAAGNVYIADTGNNAIKEWSPVNDTITPLPISGLNSPYGVAVDGAGNVYIADTGNSDIKEWIAASNAVTTLPSSGLGSPYGIAVDRLENVYVADGGNQALEELPRAFVDPTPKYETLSAGADVLSVVLPATENLGAPFAPTGSQPWLTITGVTNDVVSFSFTATAANRLGSISLLGQNISVDQLSDTLSSSMDVFGPGAGSDSVVLTVPAGGPQSWTATSQASWLHPGVTSGTGSATVNFTFDANSGGARVGTLTIAGQTLTVLQEALALGSTNRVEGPAAGTDSVVLGSLNTPWTATANAPWLHLSVANQSGPGSTNVIFTFDSNPGPTRAGIITIAGLSLAVTQAGSNYISAPAPITQLAGGLNASSVAVDGAGNVYIASPANNAIEEWSPANNSVTTLVSSGLNQPRGVAVDGAGNVYIADTGNNAIKEWVPANNSVTTLISSGLSSPAGVAVDGAGNVYIADVGDSTIKEWMPANNSLNTLVSSGLKNPFGVAVDVAGNVYIADTLNNAIKEWSPASNTVTTLVSSGLSSPEGVMVDGAGNVYIANTGNSAIMEWSPLNNTVTTLSISGLSSPESVAVDGSGNIYIADTGHAMVKELPRAFVAPSPVTVSSVAGEDSLPVVLPATENLGAPFAPITSQPWLSVTGANGGVVNFAFAANIGPSSRTAGITVLGQNIAVTQLPYLGLATGTRLEGPGAGMDSVVVSAGGPQSWTATANSPWLRLDAGYQSGDGSTNVIFSFDANTGATRAGTLTIAGQTLTVTQAGSNYVQAPGPLTTLVPTGPSGPFVSGPSGVALDAAGNVYIADTGNSVIWEWTLANNTVTALPIHGLQSPQGVAVDGSGNVYVADTGNNAIKEWSSASGMTTLVSSGVSAPASVAVDAGGNVYIADTGDNAIKEWTPANNSVTTLVSSGLSGPAGVSVDAAGNVYIADTANNAIKEWSPANNTVTALPISGLSAPAGVAVDVAGNVFIADANNSAIKVWLAASNTVTALVSSSLNTPHGVAVDGSGNAYIADSGHNQIKEVPRAFVVPTPFTEIAGPGQDSLPVVLPPTENLGAPFAPTTSQSWLSITGVTNGVVGFAFSDNAGISRTANIQLLGQSIPVTQIASTLGTGARLEGPGAGMDSVVLSAAGQSWSATANAPWLHLSAAGQSGFGNANVIFSFDANPGATRVGTLIVAGQTVTVTQAGSTYVKAPGPLESLRPQNFPVYYLGSATVDSAGNAYFADADGIAGGDVLKWNPANNTLTSFISGFYSPTAVAVDAAGNLYIADDNPNGAVIWKLTVATGSMVPLPISGLKSPIGVAVDSAGNVYIVDASGEFLEWSPANNTTTTTPLPSTVGLLEAVAFDSAGNLYFAESDFAGGESAVQEWSPANNSVTTLASSGLNYPDAVAVDEAGNVYIADANNNAIYEWSAASNSMTALVSSGLNGPTGVAVDANGNVYISDFGHYQPEELPNAFVDPTTRPEPVTAGSDALPVVLPSTADLGGPFTPSSDQSWLTNSGVSGGVVSFNYAANTGPARTAHINLLGKPVSVTQASYIVPVNPIESLSANGTFQFFFTNTPGASFTVLASTNLALPLNEWTPLGSPTENPPGQFHFTAPSTNENMFYDIGSP